MELKIIKQGNEIEDICISYGLCKILDDNDIEYRLKDNLSMYSIYTDDFNVDDIYCYEVNPEDVWNINGSLKKSEISKNIVEMNEFIKNNIITILKHYIYGDEITLKAVQSKSIGNSFYGYGVRGGKIPKQLNISPIYKWLSFLGWINNCTYVKTDSVEITALIKPYDTCEIYKPFNFSYVDKETGDLKILTKLRDNSDINIMARIYLETLLKYNIVKDECNNIMFIKNISAGNKPLADKTTSIKVLNISCQLIEDLLKKITYSNVNINCERVTSLFVLQMERYNNFSNIIKEYSKNNCLIDLKFKEEIISMYSEVVKSVYNNEVVNKLGYGLNRLLKDGKGFEIQNKLYSVANEKHIFNIIRNILDKYNRTYGKALISNEELKGFTEIIVNKDSSKITADAILSYTKVFIKIK